MSKGKKIYFLVLLLITILVTTFYFSYAIFSNTKEEHGKLNIVAGTLNYKIESSELDSDSITLEANTSKEIKIKLTSLNEVSSKYELYYILDKTNNKVSVGYSKDTKDNVSGTIEGSSSKMISIVVRNDSDTTTKVTFKVLGGLVNNELALKDGNSLNKEVSLCRYKVGYVWNFDYTGREQEFTTPCSGNYKLETWGAQGGGYDNNKYGGYGGYSIGNVNLPNSKSFYIYVGGKGGQGSYEIDKYLLGATGGYNGGGNGGAGKHVSGGGGGGATHISTDNKLLKDLENNIESILMVSGAGGGSSSWGSPGAGGGYKGNSTGTVNDQHGTEFPYKAIGGSSENSPILFGYGSTAPDRKTFSSWGAEGKGGGGSGYYGGETLENEGPHSNCAGAGGSGYIGNPLLTNKAMYCYNCEESSEESTKTISTTCVSETPTSNCSKQGNGYARITYLGN